MLPLDNRVLHASTTRSPTGARPAWSTLYPGTSPVPESVAPNVKNRGHRIDVDVTIPAEATGPAEGVLLAQGSVLGGFSFHLLEAGFATSTTSTARAPRRRGTGTGAGRPTRGSPTASTDTTTPVATPPCWSTARSWPRGTIPLFTMAVFNGTNAGLTCGYELGPGRSATATGAVPVHGHDQDRHHHPDEHAPLNPLVEFERIMAEQ